MATAKMRGLYVRLQMWNGGYKQACAVTTFKSLIGNCIIGVTEGFRYRMKMVHAHFPITAIIAKDKKQVEIKNFLGGKKSHLIRMQEGCTVMLNPAKDVKNELVFEGIDNAAVSLCCAQVAGGGGTVELRARTGRQCSALGGSGGNLAERGCVSGVQCTKGE